jgi:hypothetical protein
VTARGVDFTGMAYLAVIAGTGLIVYAVWKNSSRIGAAAGKVADAVNPTSANNLAARAANAVTQAATGDPGTSFGSWVYDKFNTPAPRLDAPSMPRPRTIDLGTYADTADRDDRDILIRADPFSNDAATMREAQNMFVF